MPGDRTFSWGKVRALLGTNRISMPDADTAMEVTGYERGTITPFGSATALPVIADSHLVGRRISIGGGAHGVGLTVQGDDVIRLFDATVADISDEEAGRACERSPRLRLNMMARLAVAIRRMLRSFCVDGTGGILARLAPDRQPWAGMS